MGGSTDCRAEARRKLKLAPHGLAFLLAATLVQAGEVTVHVFGLFRPRTLVVSGAGRTMTIREPASFAESTDWTLEVPGKIARRFQGKLAVHQRNGVLAPAVTMDLELAVASAIAAEMPADVPVEALKAMAVLARSFYVASGRPEFCDTTHCQFLREPSVEALNAARATAGTVVRYRGQPVAAMYSASCGGMTMRADGPYPYFSVSCERCAREEQTWTKTVPADRARRVVQERSERARLDLVRVLGWSALPGNNYRIEQKGDVVVFTGRGQGHGIGVCQRGAIAMARHGADFRDILRHYLPDTKIE